jgi:hypothetical protein
MSRGAQTFKQGDLVKALKAMTKAGVQVSRSHRKAKLRLCGRRPPIDHRNPANKRR